MVEEWLDEADRFGLMRRSSATSPTRQMHPLLRDFLGRRLRSRFERDDISKMHARVARAMEPSDPLMAARHFLEAGCGLDAMRCVAGSLVHTMGTGQWGVASDLVDRLMGTRADPAVAAIQSRRYIESGDLDRAAQVLASTSADGSPADVRAVFRHAKLTLGWRTGDRELMSATLDEIATDPETPGVLRDIFSFWSEAGLGSPKVSTYLSLVTKLERMSEDHDRDGFTYYSAIGRHNAGVMSAAAGQFREAIRFANEALARFDDIPGVDYERYSTHALLGNCYLELGDKSKAEDHQRIALSTGDERGDVHIDVAYGLAIVGEQTRAARLLESALELRRVGRSDAAAEVMASLARAFMALSTSPAAALAELEANPVGLPLDTGVDIDGPTFATAAYLLVGDVAAASAELDKAMGLAIAKGSRRSESRIKLLHAILQEDADALRVALAGAASVGHLAILSVADVLGRNLWLIPEGPVELRDSISMWRPRWLPVLRRQLDDGGTSNAVAAAQLLDEYGEVADVVRLRAFAKTYRRPVRGSQGLGRQLARKVAPVLEIRDLGRTELHVGDRTVSLGEMRRKASSLLMYLVTRPSHSATRDQVLEQLWPESDPEAAANSLNQALYYLRRDIDPWFEEDISVDYVMFQGDLLWLDPALVRITSAEFARAARAPMGDAVAADHPLTVLGMYSGRFCPEFEYEEWATGWLNRVHTMFLHFAASAIGHYARRGLLQEARDAALLALTHDPDAREIEQKLVWLYWHEGARSSAQAQFQHLTAVERADGLDPSRLEDLTGDQMP